jgi:hypothetical protein
MATGYNDTIWALPSFSPWNVMPQRSYAHPGSASFWYGDEPVVQRFERVTQVVVQHIEVFVCDHCNSKYKEFMTKCHSCGAPMSGRRETL